MNHLIKSLILQPLRDLLYPPLCWLCDGLLDADSAIVCPACLNKLSDFKDSDNCIRQDENAVDRFYILYEFDETLRQLVHFFKYKHAKGLAGVLAQRGFERFFRNDPADYSCVLAVPLHPARERERGYNQSALLAKQLAMRMDLTYEPAALQRTRFTPSQTRLSRSERPKNVAGAFKADLTIPGGHVLLVDDVITTGSTVNACAGVLKLNGVTKVDVFALANPIPGKDHPAD